MVDLLFFLFDWRFLLIMELFALIEAIWNISLFRWQWSWLPFGYNTPNAQGYLGCKILQDPFHIFKGMQSILALWLIWIFYRQDFFFESLQQFHYNPTIGFVDFLLIFAMIPLIWLIYYGLGMFTWNYHIFLIKPEYWKQEIWRVFPLVIYKKWIRK
jgi:hypothetical protein